MASNFDRFLAGILQQGVQQLPGMGAQIQQAAQGLPAGTVQRIMQLAGSDAIQGVNRFNSPVSTQEAPHAPLDMTPYIQATGGDPRRMASTGAVTPDQPPVQGPVLNPSGEYRPPAEAEPMLPEAPKAGGQTGRSTDGYAPAGTPLTDAEGYVAVEILVQQPEGGAKPLRIMVPEHYLKDGVPEGVTVFGEGQTTPGAQIPDEVKLEAQPEEIRFLFTDYRDTQQTARRETPDTPEARAEAALTYDEPLGVSLAPEQAQQRDLQRQGITAGPPVPEPVASFSVDELADTELAGKLKDAGITTIRDDQYPLTDPETGAVRLATQQEIIDEDLAVPVEWMYEDEAFVAELKAAGITTIRQSQMPQKQGDVITVVDRPDDQGLEPVGTALPPITPEYLERYRPEIANEMRSAGIPEIPDGMVLTRENGRLVTRTAGTVEDADVIFYGGQSSLPDPGFLRRSDGSLGNPAELLGVAVEALPRDYAERGLRALDAGTRGAVVNDVGSMLYERVTGKDVDRTGPDWLYAGLDRAGLPIEIEQWADENPALVTQLFEQGYDADGDGKADFTGGRAIWEYHAGNEQNLLDRVIGEIVLDPTTLLAGGGAVAGAGRRVLGSGAANTLPREAVGRGLYGIGRAMEIVDALPERALLAPVRAVARRPVAADNLARGAVSEADRVAAAPLLPDGDTRLAGMGRAGIVPEGAVLERGEYTGPVGRLFNSSDDAALARETQGTAAIADNAIAEAGRNARRGIGLADEPPPPGAAGPVTPDTPPAPDAPVQQALPEAQQAVPAPEVVDAMPPEQRVREIEEADAVQPQAPVEIVRDATDLPTPPTTAPARGMGIATDEATGLPRPTPRQWGSFAPKEGGNYIVSRLWETAKDYPNRWRAFHDEVNAQITEYTNRRATVNQQGKQRREALERERQARVASGQARDGDDVPVRLFDEAAVKTVDELNLLLDIYRAAKRTYGDVGEIAHQFSTSFRRDATREGRDRGFYGQQDNYFIERAVFGTPRQSALAMGQLRYRALELGDEVLARELPRIERMRQDWEAVQRGDVPTAGTLDAAAGRSRMSRDRIRTTVGMTDEQLQAVGLPDRLQPRQEPFSKLTVDRIVREGYDFDRAPIIVKEGTDGNYYIVSGHSRFEAAGRLNVDEVPVNVTTREGDDLLRLARDENQDVTGFTTRERAGQTRADIEAGETFTDVAQRSNRGNETTGAIGTSRARGDYMISQIPEDARGLWDLIDQGLISDEIAELIGAGFAGGHLPLTDAARIASRVTSGHWGIDDVRAAIYRVVRKNRKPVQNEMGLFGADATPATSPLSGAMDEIADLTAERNGLFADRRKVFRDNGMQRSRQYDMGKLPDDARADVQAIEDRIRSVSEELGIAPADALKERAPITANASSLYDDTGKRIDETEAGDPTTSQTTAFSTVPGGPQLSRVLTDPETGGWRRVKNLNAANALDPEGRRTAKLIEIDDALTSREKDFLATGHGIVLTSTELTTLSRRIGGKPDSPTAMQLWETYRREAMEGGADALSALERSSQRMLQDVYVDAMRRVSPNRHAKYQTALAEILEKDPKTDLYEAHITAARIAGDRSRKVPQAYDTYLATQREIRLYNPITGSRYVMTQAVGNTLTAMLGTGLVRGSEITKGIFTGWKAARDDIRGAKDLRAEFRTPVSDPGEIRRAALEAEREVPGSTLDEADRLFLDTGLIRNDTVITLQRESGQGIGTAGTLSQETMTEQLMNRYRWAKPFTKQMISRGPEALQRSSSFASLLANPVVREMANAFDLSARKATFAQRMRANIAGVQEPFREHMRRSLPEGADAGRLDEILAELPDVFSDDHLRLALGEIDAGYAERIGRDWRSTLRSAEKDANAEVNRLFFSGQELNIDQKLRRVIMFHYWMSRATPLYTQSLMKHVGLMTNFFQMMQELDEQSAQYGTPVKGMLALFKSQFGYNIFIRPDGLLQTVLSLEPQGGFDPEGESPIMGFLRTSGLMFNPMILSAGNFLGLAGDTFAPDPLSLQTHAAFVTAGIDVLKGAGVGAARPTRNRYQEFNAWIRSGTSGIAEDLGIPGAKQVEFQRSDQFAMVEINNLGIDIAEERGMDWDDPEDQMQIVASMNDPESELYNAAFNRYAAAGGFQWALRLLPTSVLYPKLRSAGKDERSLTMRSTTRTDPAHERARDQRDTAMITDPDVRTLKVQQDEYQNIGTEQQREAYSTYNAIRFGPVKVPIVYNGVSITERQLRRMTLDERTAIADAWAERTGVSAEIDTAKEQRTAFREEHPEYAAYYDWTMRLNDHEGGAQAYWNDLIKVNENAARFHAGLGELESGDLERRLTSVDAFLAAEGLRPSGYDKDPLPTGGITPSTLSLMGGGGTGYGVGRTTDPAQRIADDIATYRAESAAVEARVKEILGPDATVDKILTGNPQWRDGYLAQLERNGVTLPQYPAETRRYLEWAEAQEPGADTSINTYLKWRESTDLSTTAPEGSGDLQLEELLRLLN